MVIWLLHLGYEPPLVDSDVGGEPHLSIPAGGEPHLSIPAEFGAPPQDDQAPSKFINVHIDQETSKLFLVSSVYQVQIPMHSNEFRCVALHCYSFQLCLRQSLVVVR